MAEICAISAKHWHVTASVAVLLNSGSIAL